MKQTIKRVAISALTTAFGDSEGYVTLPTLRGAARGMRFRLNLKTFIEPAYLLGSYEREEVEFVSSFIKPEWTVWDCGIYLGFYTALFAKRCREVIAFEPDPANIERTKHNLALNNISNVRFIEAAVGEPHTTVNLVISENTNSHIEGAFIGRDRTDYATRERVDRVISARSISLDEALDEAPAPDMVKIDIEGAEGLALKYTDRLCREVRPHIILELHNPECDRAAWAWSQRTDYTLHSLEENRVFTSESEVHGTLLCSPQ